MKVARLRTQGFRGLPDHTYSFAHARSGAPFDVVLITGDAGSGKTSLLEAIIAAKEDIGAYGTPPAQATYLREGTPTARLDVSWLLSASEAHRAGLRERMVSTTSILGEGAPPLSEHPSGLRALFREHSRDAAQGKVEYFHAERTLPPGRGMRYRGDVVTTADAWMASRPAAKSIGRCATTSFHASTRAALHWSRRCGNAGSPCARRSRTRSSAFEPSCGPSCTTWSLTASSRRAKAIGCCSERAADRWWISTISAPAPVTPCSSR